MNNAMTLYRLSHVELITSVYNDLVPVFGREIEAARISRRYVDQIIADVLLALGGK